MIPRGCAGQRLPGAIDSAPTARAAAFGRESIRANAREIPAAGGDGGATFDRPKVAKSRRGNPTCPGPSTASLWGGGTVRGSSPRRRGSPPTSGTRDGGRVHSRPNPARRTPGHSPLSPSCGGALERGTRPPPHPLAAYPKWVARCLTGPKSLVQKEGVYGGTWFPRQIARRPAMRCRTAFPQKCRDGGPGGASSLPVGHSSSIPLALFSWTARRPVLFSRGKREWGAESASPWGRKKRGLWPHRKVRAALRRKERGGEAAPFFWVQHILAPAGILSSSMTRWSFSSPFSVWTAEMSIPQLSWPIIFRGGRLTMASRVLPTSSSGS